MVADLDMDDATRADMQQVDRLHRRRLSRTDFETALRDAGLIEIEIRETPRVHEHAGSAIIRARKS